MMLIQIFVSLVTSLLELFDRISIILSFFGSLHPESTTPCDYGENVSLAMEPPEKASDLLLQSFIDK